MGITAEAVARRYGISRADQDAFAAESQRRAARRDQTPAGSPTRSSPVDDPAEEGRPDPRSTRDEYPRAGTTVEKLGGAEAGVSEGRHGDGRQRVGHQRRRRGAGRGRRARGRRVTGARAAGADPGVRDRRRRAEAHGDRARCPPCARRSSAPGSTLDDIDLFELNEAFAAQALAVVQRARSSIPRASTSTAAPSRSAIRSAPAARACSTTLLYHLRAHGRTLRRGVAVHRRRHGRRDGGPAHDGILTRDER